MTTGDAARNVLWALVTLLLATESILSLLSFPTTESALVVTAQVVTAAGVLVRRPAIAGSVSLVAVLVAATSTLQVYLYSLDSASAGWISSAGAAASVIGSGICIYGLLSLGRSFAVLPSFRRLRSAGAYAVVRHPIYLGYLLVDVGWLLRYPTPINGIVIALGVPLLLWRIALEERLLGRFAEYRDYRRRVRFRLLPGLY